MKISKKWYANFLQKRVISTKTSVSHNYPEKYIRNASLYIHWPYCRQRCSYCNFVKYVPRSGTSWTIKNEKIEDLMIKEIKYNLTNSTIKNVTSIYFGGGTPSLASPSFIQRVISAVKQYCTLDCSTEISLEVNPTLEETEKLEEFKSNGINRVSIGVQALDNDSLKQLNRDHDLKDALYCIDVARSLFPGKVSTDLIFGRPGQTLEGLEEELNKLINLSDDHISLYQLTVERGTSLYKQIKKGHLSIPDVDIQADMYELVISTLRKGGYSRYEVSNFSKGIESRSIHNQNYWYGGQYLGIGPGAHSRIIHDGTRKACINILDPLNWSKSVLNTGNSIRKVVIQNQLDIQNELLLTALRTKTGITSDLWKNVSSESLLETFTNEIDHLTDLKLLYLSHTCIKATEKGLNVIDSILPFLLKNLQNKC